MLTVSLKPFISERVTYDDPGTVVPAHSDATVSIPLSRADYTHGEMVLHVKRTGGYTLYQGLSAFYKFTVSTSGAQGSVIDISTNFISLCVYYDRWRGGYAFRNDGKLSGSIWHKSGGGTHLVSIAINGAQIDMVFHNNHATAASTLGFSMTADVWKVNP